LPLIYKFLPDVVISWKDVWIGAAVTALLFTGGKYAIGIYLGRNCDDECVWSGRLARRPAVLGLLLCADQLFGSGVHAGLRAPVWPRHQPKEHAVRVGRKSDSI
jgi:hypothetical protein